jgi:hypothetical protein
MLVLGLRMRVLQGRTLSLDLRYNVLVPFDSWPFAEVGELDDCKRMGCGWRRARDAGGEPG